MGIDANADEILMQRHLRAFTQRGGSRPSKSMRYSGPDEQSLMFGDVANPRRGNITPVRDHDWYNRNQYRLIGRGQAAPDLQTVTITFKRRHGGATWIMDDMTCPNTFFELAGDCGQPDSFLYGWTDFVSIYSNALATSSSHKGRKSADSDDPMTDELEFTLASFYDIAGLSFGENAQTAVEREVVDLAYVSGIECGNCGVNNDGTQRLYTVTKSSGSASPGIPPEIIWTINGGSSYNQSTITGLGSTVDPTGLEIFGNFLFILDTTGSGYWISELNRLTGAPSSWSNVTIGFSAGAPTDMFIASNSLMFLCGNSGTIYKITNALLGAELLYSSAGANLKRINGDGNGTIVAVGESGVVLKTINNGATWSLVASPTSGTLRTVEVMDKYTYWIGSGTGGLWFTEDGGESWTQVTLGSDVVRLDDIVFATNEVGYILTGAPNVSTARLYTTYNSGRDWSSTAISTNPRLLNWLTFTRGNRIAVPRLVPDSVAARRVAIAGLAGNGTDGIVIQGVQRVI